MNRSQSIRFRGRTYQVQDRWHIGRCEYLILQRLSERGIARYLAFDRHAGPDGDLCVIHVLPKSRRAIQQLAVLRGIAKTNRSLPKLLRYEADGEVVRVVTEWVVGEDMQSYLDQAHEGRKPWPSPVEAFRLFRDLAHGLFLLNKKTNVIHGDVKPANLILCPNSRQMVLVDYGSAWPIERTARRDPGDGHTPGYAAPELLTDGDISRLACDQFSATVVLYEMLTGELPYGNQGGNAALSPQRAKLEAAYVPPSRNPREHRFVPESVWQQIDAVVARGLALDAEQRFCSGGEWLSALKHLDAGMSLANSPETPFQRNVSRLLDLVERWWPRGEKDRDRS